MKTRAYVYRVRDLWYIAVWENNNIFPSHWLDKNGNLYPSFKLEPSKTKREAIRILKSFYYTKKYIDNTFFINRK